MTLVVLTYRKYRKDGKRYRTRYYRECIDGRPRMGSKRQAVAFDEKEAEVVLAQLRTLQPARSWEALSMLARPPRYKGPPPEEPKQPTQADAFDPC